MPLYALILSDKQYHLCVPLQLQFHAGCFPIRNRTVQLENAVLDYVNFISYRIVYPIENLLPNKPRKNNQSVSLPIKLAIRPANRLPAVAVR